MERVGGNQTREQATEQIKQRLERSVWHGLRVVLCCLLVVVATSPVPAQTVKAIVGDTLAVALPVGSAGADFDGSGEVGFGDFLLFVQAYQTDHAEFDLSDDGVVDLTDFLTFVEFYGQIVDETPVEMVFAYIPNGTFTMGSPDSSSWDNEKPQHEVTINQGFYLGKCEVTQGEWEAVMGSNPSFYSGSEKPVQSVSWHEVQDFVHRLNVAAGDSLYRLPTEGQWEYACRAGTTTQWSFGENESDLENYAWYSGNNSPIGPKSVGTKLANPWGLFDMHGNVEEWCQDWDGEYSSSAQADPPGPVSGSRRVTRGGSFYQTAQYVRSTKRYRVPPGAAGGGIGFRLLRRAQ